VFRRLVRGLIEARTANRQKPFELVIDRLREAKEPSHCVNILLEECATNSGTDGLELGIDVLSHAGMAVFVTAERFLASDARTRERHLNNNMRLNVHDDVWYMLLRAVARAKVPPLAKLHLIGRCINYHPSPIVKAAGVYALGDLAEGTDPERFVVLAILKALLRSPNATVKEVAAKVFSDLEG
jgi:hypothetical protein